MTSNPPLERSSPEILESDIQRVVEVLRSGRLALGPGDDLLVPSLTFAATVNAILYEGARPVFAEVEAGTFNVDPADLEGRITPRTRAILAVDAFGHPAEWGAQYWGRPLGSFVRAGTFAFYPSKQVTTREGGMVVTDDPALARTVRSLARRTLALPFHNRLSGAEVDRVVRALERAI